MRTLQALGFQLQADAENLKSSSGCVHAAEYTRSRLTCALLETFTAKWLDVVDWHDNGAVRGSTGWVAAEARSERPRGTAAVKPMYCFHHSATFSSAHPLFFRYGKLPSN